MSANELIDYSAERTKGIYHQGYSKYYREYDEQYTSTPDYKHYTDKLTNHTLSFPYKIDVLDIGCGTGRYFHALQNVHLLTGIDISINMLNEAQNPLYKGEVRIEKTDLIEGNFYEHDFREKKFDFIYSIGVLGEHAPFTLDACNKIFDLLNEGGVCYITLVDIKHRKNLKRKIADILYIFMPASIKRKLDERWKACYMTRKQVDNIITQSKFTNYNIGSYRSQDTHWQGVHFEFEGRK